MFGKPKHVTILKHHRNSAVYLEGRYLHVDTKVSMKSKRGREIATETAHTILNAVAEAEGDVVGVLPTGETNPDADRSPLAGTHGMASGMPKGD